MPIFFFTQVGVYQIDFEKRIIRHRQTQYKIKVDFLAEDTDWNIDQNYAPKAAKLRNSHGMSQQIFGLFAAKGIHLPKSNQVEKKKSGTLQAPKEPAPKEPSGLQLVKGEDGKFRLGTAPTHVDGQRSSQPRAGRSRSRSPPSTQVRCTPRRGVPAESCEPASTEKLTRQDRELGLQSLPPRASKCQASSKHNSKAQEARSERQMPGPGNTRSDDEQSLGDDADEDGEVDDSGENDSACSWDRHSGGRALQ